MNRRFSHGGLRRTVREHLLPTQTPAGPLSILVRRRIVSSACENTVRPRGISATLVGQLTHLA